MLSRPNPQHMHDTAQIRQQIDLLTKQFHIVRIQFQEIKRLVEKRFFDGCEFVCDIVPIQSSPLETNSTDIDALFSSDIEDGGYDGPPIFDEEYEDIIPEVGNENPMQFDEDNGGYDGPPIFDKEDRNYDDPPIFDKKIENVGENLQCTTKEKTSNYKTSWIRNKIHDGSVTSFVVVPTFRNEWHVSDWFDGCTINQPLIWQRGDDFLPFDLNYSIIDPVRIYFDIHLVFPSRPPRAPPWVDNSFIYDLPSDSRTNRFDPRENDGDKD